MPLIRRTKHLLLSLIILGLAVPTAFAEYKLYSLQNFEATGGDFPQGMVHGHHSSPYTTVVADLTQPSLPKDLTAGISSDIIGKYALQLQPIQDDPHLSVVNNVYLDRSRLGANGAALFQVDFYLPGPGEDHPTIAILASAHQQNQGSRAGEKSEKY